MKIMWILASLRRCEIRWKPSGDKKPAWNRARASIGAASPTFKNISLKACTVWVSSVKAAIAFASRFNILSSRHRGLEGSEAEAVTCKYHSDASGTKPCAKLENDIPDCCWRTNISSMAIRRFVVGPYKPQDATIRPILNIFMALRTLNAEASCTSE